MHSPLRVGLTGGIGSGKSTVAALFGELGVAVIDADRIAHVLTAPRAEATRRIGEMFGPAFLDPAGALKRRLLRQHVFTHPDERRRLEALLHPLIDAQMEAEAAHATGPYCVLVIPLLVETARWHLVDRILLVEAPEPDRIRRVVQRDQVDESDVQKILAVQAPSSLRRQHAHEVLENSGDVTALRALVQDLDRTYRRLASAAR